MLDFTCSDDDQEDDYQNLCDNLISSQTEIKESDDTTILESYLSSSNETVQDATKADQPEDLTIETTAV